MVPSLSVSLSSLRFVAGDEYTKNIPKSFVFCVPDFLCDGVICDDLIEQWACEKVFELTGRIIASVGKIKIERC
jgi:hypothetical protein